MKKILVTIMFLFGLVMTGCGETKVDLSNYVDVSISGLNGQATATCEMKMADLEEVLADGKDEDLELVQMLYAIEESIGVSIDKEENISNGDKITATITCDDEVAKKYDFKFVGKKKEIKVEGLSDGTVVDLFKDISLEYSGVAPDAEVTICNTSDDAFLKNVTYSADNRSGLSNGDKIRVTADYNEENALDYEYIVEQTEKEYIVEGVDEYLTEYSQIDNETLDKMKEQAKDVIETELADDWHYNDYMYPDGEKYEDEIENVKVKSIDLYKSYFFCLKDGMDGGWEPTHNSIFMVYKVTTKDSQSPKGTVAYIPVYYRNFISRDSGIDVVITDGYATDGYTNYDNLYREIVTENKAEYTFEEIEY